MKPSLLIFLLVVFFTCNIYAQDDTTEEETPTEAAVTNLGDQYNTLKKSSNTYNSFKIIRETKLDAFWADVTDSIAATKEQYQQAQTQVGDLQNELKGIKNDMAAKDKELAAHQHAITHISVLGIDIPKESFIYTFWGVISFLVLALLIMAYRFRENSRVTSTTRKEYTAVKEELEEFKKRSLEKEKKLRRELQTERNTVEELKMMTSQRR